MWLVYFAIFFGAIFGLGDGPNKVVIYVEPRLIVAKMWKPEMRK